jgi:hypothetical protein
MEIFLFGLPDVTDGTATDFRIAIFNIAGLGVCTQPNLALCARLVEQSQFDPTIVASGESVILNMRFTSQANSVGDFVTFTARIGMKARGQGAAFEARNINLPRIPVANR